MAKSQLAKARLEGTAKESSFAVALKGWQGKRHSQDGESRRLREGG